MLYMLWRVISRNVLCQRQVHTCTLAVIYTAEMFKFSQTFLTS